MHELVQMDRVLASHDVLEGRALAGLDKVKSRSVRWTSL